MFFHFGRRLILIGAALASGIWATGDLPAASNTVLVAITWTELPVICWVSLLVEAAAGEVGRHHQQRSDNPLR